MFITNQIIFKKLFFIIFIIIFISGCSKKITVSTYSDVNIPLSHLENVNTTIEGSSKFIDNINSFLPSEFNDYEILKNDPNSPYILHIIENNLLSSTRYYETKEKKIVEYVDYIFHPKHKKRTPVVKKRKIIYFQKCLVTKYTLSASVTTRFKRETIFVDTEDEQCIKKRFNLFNSYDLQSRHGSLFYDHLVSKLSQKIKNYLIPSKTSYSVDIDEDIDIVMSDIDEENYENIIDILEDGIFSNEIFAQLIKLNNKYPNSYSINYNLGLLYEYIAENKKALFYYKKCLKIKTTKDIIKRIETIKNNINNKEKTKL